MSRRKRRLILALALTSKGASMPAAVPAKG